MNKEEIFAIIDDELEKRKLDTFLLWDFPNDVKKRIEELYQSGDNTKHNTITETLLDKLEMLSDCAEAMKEAPSSNWIEYAKTEAELDLKLYFAYLDVKQGILKEQEQEKILKIIKEKNVDIIAIKESKTLEEYNRNAWEVEHYGRYKGYRLQLTEEEFNTLKEYSKYEYER